MINESTETEGKTDGEKEATTKEAEEVEVEVEETAAIAEEARKEEEEAPERGEEEEIVEERIYTVPLGRAWIVPRKKHTPKAVRLLRKFIMRHMKASEDSIRIEAEVNEKIWGRGIEKPPRQVRVRATKDADGIITIHLAEGD